MAIVILALLVIVVAIDMLRRFDREDLPRAGEQTLISTQKIVIDLTKRL